MKIVFMGSPDFAAVILEKLFDAGFDIAEVISNPDKSRGRKKELIPSETRAKAMELGIPTRTTARIRNPEEIEHLRDIAPDMIIVAAFGQIIPSEILELPRFGCINVHASLLPAYRGAAPIQWAILNGDSEAGVTIMKMGEGLDTGDMISRKVIPISDSETAGSLFDKMAYEGAELLIKTIPEIENGTAVYTAQPEESTTSYAGMIKKEMGRIKWDDAAEKIERLVRGMNPWPCAYTYLDGKMLKIWKSSVSNDSLDLKPGSVMADKDNIYVGTGEGTLKIEELQLEGKKRMGAVDFLKGKQVDGSVLG